ncbi:hypothetical protein, partial [Yersinia ruckeri]
ELTMNCLYSDYDIHQYQQTKKPLGTVEYNNTTANFKNIDGQELSLSGLTIVNLNAKQVDDGSRKITTQLKVDKLKALVNPSLEPEFFIEWVLNIGLGSYPWPESIETLTNEELINKIGSQEPLTFLSNTTSCGSSMSCCHITIEGIDIYFGKALDCNIDNTFSPGFILYKGKASDEFRSKFIDALSFMVGSKIIYIGNIILDIEHKIISKEAITPNTMNGLFFKEPKLPPCSLAESNAIYLLIDKKTIENFISNFIFKYEQNEIPHILWLYFHAIIAPIHLQAVCFGAVLEFTQKAYIKKHKSSFSTKLVTSEKWKEISLSLDNAIENINEIDESALSILRNKISNLNNTPQDIQTKRFFEVIGINLGEIEKNSYKRRHDAAHGNKTPNADYISLIRENKVLRVMCNRVIIKILSLSDNYCDFYTLNNPCRNICDPID